LKSLRFYASEKQFSDSRIKCIFDVIMKCDFSLVFDVSKIPTWSRYNLTLFLLYFEFSSYMSIKNVNTEEGRNPKRNLPSRGFCFLSTTSSKTCFIMQILPSCEYKTSSLEKDMQILNRIILLKH
jgi:hypothetical protein